MANKKTTKSGSSGLWGGRFDKSPSELTSEFIASLPYDKILAPYDIAGSIAHARMLAKCKIITKVEAGKIIKGLKSVLKEIESGKAEWDINDEDIHMWVEKRLTRKIGRLGGKLHTARSRNDQIALDIRLYLKDMIPELAKNIKKFQKVLVKKAEKHIGTILPGFTHLQPAQPVLLAHHMLAYFQMFDRDLERLSDLYKRVMVMPLGAAALAGTTFNVDPMYVAEQLGFRKVAANSLDAVSDRDHLAETVNACALIMMHLSKMAEEIIIWANPSFGYIELDDAYSSGSSIMPQKKNPDVAEMIRGKTGRVYGDLTALLTMLKGQPLAYNRDLQEDKEPLFDALETTNKSLIITADMLATAKFNAKNMLASCQDGFLLATDVADYLVRQGLPFRQAHGIVGKAVGYASKKGVRLEDLSETEWTKFSKSIGGDVRKILSLEKSVASRKSPGGTAPVQVKREIAKAKKKLVKPFA